MTKSYKKTAQDTLINGGAQLLLIPLTFIRLPVLTKNLSIQEYGLWGLIFTTCSLALPFTSLGLGAAMNRFLPGEKEKEGLQEGFYSVLTLRMLVTFVVGGCVFLFAGPIADIFFDGFVSIVQITALFIVLITLHGIYRRLLRILRKIGVLSLISILDGYISIALFAALLYSGYGLMSIVLAQLAIKIAEVSYLVFYVRPYIGFKLPHFKPIKGYLNYGLPTLPASMSFWLVNITDRFIISFLLSTSAVGVYSAAYAIGNIPHLISGLINFIMMVALSELYDKGKMNEVRHHLSYSLKYFLTLSIPFAFGSMVYSDRVLYALSTQEIAENAGLITPIVSLAHILLGVYAVLTYVLLLRKKTKILPVIWLFALSLNLGLNFYLIPRVGPIGAAVSTLIAYAIALFVVVYFALREFRFDPNWSFILKSIFSSIIMTGVLLGFPVDGHMMTFTAIITGIGLYFLLIVLMKGFTKKEYDLFLGLLKGFLPQRST